MAAYHKNIWFSKRAITNIISLINIIQQYWVAFDSKEKKYIVLQEAEDKPNMDIITHNSGLHYYNPRYRHFSLLTLSLVTRKVTHRDKSRAQKLQSIFKLVYAPHPEKNSSG